MIRIFHHYVSKIAFMLLLLEVLILLTAAVASAPLWLKGRPGGAEQLYLPALAFALVVVFSMGTLGMYQHNQSREDIKSTLLRILPSFVLGFGLMTLLAGMIPGAQFGRLGSMVFVLGGASVLLARLVVFTSAQSSMLEQRLLIIGDGAIARECMVLAASSVGFHQFRVVGFVPVAGEASSVPASMLLPSDLPLLVLARRYAADEIVVSVGDRRNGAFPVRQLLECALGGVPVTDAASFFEREACQIRVDSLQPSYENGTPATSAYQAAREHLQHEQFRWVVTGVAGFIGSNLLQALLELGQRVVGVDNFLTGYHHNLDQVREQVGASAWRCFELIEGDIRDPAVCRAACDRADYVLHQAALGSVARSIDDPLLCNDINIGGFLNVLDAARLAGARRLVYAASSASYGDHPGLPKREQHIGNALSPYALTKHVNELYAGVYARCYRSECIGLRYFNVFGPRQDPAGAYAAVIPLWIAAMIEQRPLVIHGDGESSRDFCFVANAVQANLLAALVDKPAAVNQVYNVALNERTSLNELYLMLHSLLVERHPQLRDFQPHYGEFRAGDVRHSQADIAKAAKLLGYAPTHDLKRGLKQALRWYETHLTARRPAARTGDSH